jgi:CheY-like chemotaxis protein
MLLKVDGYRVTAVASLTEALKITGDDDARIDLLITDYHLSEGETGIQIIAVLPGLGVSLKAVLITGDTSSMIKDLPQCL